MIKQLRQAKLWFAVFVAITVCILLVLPYAKMHGISNGAVSLTLVVLMLWAASLLSRESRRLLTRFRLDDTSQGYVKTLLRAIAVVCVTAVATAALSYGLESVVLQAILWISSLGVFLFITAYMIGPVNQLDKLTRQLRPSA